MITRTRSVKGFVVADRGEYFCCEDGRDFLAGSDAELHHVVVYPTQEEAREVVDFVRRRWKRDFIIVPATWTVTLET